MFSGFQPSGYQHSGYQVLGGGGDWHGGYVHPYQKYREEEYQRDAAKKRADLAKIDSELAQVKERRKREEIALSQRKLGETEHAAELAALEVFLQEEINRLRTERVWLMRLIDEEEAILVLLLGLPLH